MARECQRIFVTGKIMPRRYGLILAICGSLAQCAPAQTPRQVSWMAPPPTAVVPAAPKPADPGVDFMRIFSQETAGMSPAAAQLANSNFTACAELALQIPVAVAQYRDLRVKGYTDHQAKDYLMRFASWRWSPLEIASHIPDGWSDNEMVSRAFRACLETSAE